MLCSRIRDAALGPSEVFFAMTKLQEEVACRYKELVRREQALAAREKLAAEVCQAQEEREEDLEQFAVRLQQQEEVRNVFRKGF